VRESLKNYRRYLANHDSAMAYAVLGVVGGVASGLVVLAFELAIRSVARMFGVGGDGEGFEDLVLDTDAVLNRSDCDCRLPQERSNVRHRSGDHDTGPRASVDAPGDDLASQIVHAEVEGHRLDLVDFQLFFLLLIDAGGDTTRGPLAITVTIAGHVPAGAALRHHLRQAVQGLGTEYEIDVRCTATDFGPFLAGYTAAHADDQIGIFLFQALPAAQLMEYFFLRFFPYRTGV
jgi:cytochrome P450